jgi:hypothetical protein
MSFWVIGSSNVRPISRLMAKSVFSGLVTAWRLADWPTRRSPSWVNATMDGVVRAPSAFSTTRGSLPSMTAMHELVVPRSIPMILPMTHMLLVAAGPGGPLRRRTNPQEAITMDQVEGADALDRYIGTARGARKHRSGRRVARAAGLRPP